MKVGNAFWYLELCIRFGPRVELLSSQGTAKPVLELSRGWWGEGAS